MKRGRVYPEGSALLDYSVGVGLDDSVVESAKTTLPKT